mgnify:CR=1 FL=1
MPIQDSDLFLINTNSNSQSFKITASKLKESLAPNLYNNYKLLVNKPDYSSRFVYAQNMQGSVAPTDYMLIERSGVSYKVTGQQIIDYFPTVPAGSAGPILDVGASVGPLEPSTLTPIPSPNVFQSCPPFNTAYSSTLSLTSLTTSFTFDGAWDMSSVAKYRGGAYDAGVPITLTFTDANGRSQSTTDTTAAGYAGEHSLTGIDFSVPITMITITVASAPGWIWGFYDSSDQGVNYPTETQSVTALLTLGGTTNLNLFTAGDAINMVDSDGDVASYTPVTSTITSISGGGTSDTILTFASPNQDLKLFGPGTKVQTEVYVVSTDTSTNTMVVDGGSWSNGTPVAGQDIEPWLQGATSTGPVPYSGSGGFTNMFDGVLETNADHATMPWYTGGGSSFNGDSFLYFNPPITSVSKVQFWGYLMDSFTGGYPSTCVLIDGNGTEHSSGLPMYRQNENVAVLGTEITPVNGIVTIKVSSLGNAGYIAGVYFDGALAVFGETVVTGPVRSGAGNFLSNNGAVVNVSNSNGGWITNDNRLGEEFFIKAASTQVGMGALRTQAIAASAAWSSATSYASLGLVQHNGRYWAAISSNSNVTPETASAATWIDLGAI